MQEGEGGDVPLRCGASLPDSLVSSVSVILVLVCSSLIVTHLRAAGERAGSPGDSRSKRRVRIDMAGLESLERTKVATSSLIGSFSRCD